MIDLERHIEILLLDNDCVIVPGLGGFMAHHVDACYDERDHLFLPPRRTLGFNAKLSMNDSLLAQSYVEAYDISYPEAMRCIDDEVNELRQALENDGSYELTDIGKLFLNSDGNIEFEPCEAGILTPQLYGLCGVDIFHAVDMSVVEKEHEESEDSKATAEVRVLTPAEDSGDERRISIPVRVIRNAVAVAAAVLVAFFLVTSPLGDAGKDNAAMSGHTDMLKKMMPKAVVYSDDAATTKQEAGATAVMDGKQEKQTAEDVKGSWCLVLASHVPYQNAEMFVHELHAAGHAEARVLTRANINKVIYGSYATAEKAHEALRQLRGEKGFKDAWVFEL